MPPQSALRAARPPVGGAKSRVNYLRPTPVSPAGESALCKPTPVSPAALLGMGTSHPLTPSRA